MPPRCTSSGSPGATEFDPGAVSSARSRPLSQAPDIDHIALSEVRLLKEARHGNPDALRQLLEPHLKAVWSLIRASSADEGIAITRARRFQERVGAGVAAFALDQPFGLQLFRYLWRDLASDLRPTDVDGIEIPSFPTSRAPMARPLDPRSVLAEALWDVHPYARLVYLFWLVIRLPMPRLAALTGEPEARLRHARALATARLYRGVYR